MRSITCQLRWEDGVTVTGAIKADSADTEYLVDYAGAVERLPRRYDRADAPLLRALFIALAQETGAQFTEQAEGSYERWAL